MGVVILSTFVFFSLIFDCDGKNNTKPFLNALESSNIYCDEKYVVNCSTEVGLNPADNLSHVLNVRIDLLQPLGRNIILSFKTFEFKNNVYKEGFLNFEQSLCFLMENERWIFPLIRFYSNLPKKCPVPTGLFEVKNLRARQDFLPSNFPPSRYRFSLIFQIMPGHKRIGQIDINLKIDPKSSKSNKKHE